jgi:hypothetical protein
MPGFRSDHFVFTINNYDADDIETLNNFVRLNNRTKITFMAYQFEAGENQTPHIQGYLQLNNKMKPKDFTDLFCSNEIGLRRRCYTHPADGSSEQCVDYVSKDDTRIAGTEPYVRGDYREIAARASRQGERTDLTALQEAIHEGKSMEDLQADHFEAFCKYDKFLTKYYIDFHQRGLKRKLIESTSGTVLRPWQQSVMDLVSGPVEDRKVRWYWEDVGNFGKTFLARHLTLHAEALKVQPMKKADLLHLLTKSLPGKRCVLFDLPRTSEDGSAKVMYEVMEMLLDQYICSGKYDSVALNTQPVHILVFANFAPDRTTMSADRWEVTNLRPL